MKKALLLLPLLACSFVACNNLDANWTLLKENQSIRVSMGEYVQYYNYSSSMQEIKYVCTLSDGGNCRVDIKLTFKSTEVKYHCYKGPNVSFMLEDL